LSTLTDTPEGFPSFLELNLATSVHPFNYHSMRPSALVTGRNGIALRLVTTACLLALYADVVYSRGLGLLRWFAPFAFVFILINAALHFLASDAYERLPAWGKRLVWGVLLTVAICGLRA
jgi:hypothetical protein